MNGDVPLRACFRSRGRFRARRVGRLDAFAERFAAEGFAVLVFDYRHFGDSAGSRRLLSTSAASTPIWQAASPTPAR